MEANAERTLHNLRVLASVSQNDKLMTNEDRFDIYCPTTLRAMMRMWYGEKRAQNVQRVRATVREAMNFASRSLEEASALLQATASSSDFRLRVDTTAVQHLRMMEALVRAQQGLRNLLQTYREDAALASQITLVVEEITDYVSVLAPHSLALQAQCPNVESCAQDCLRPGFVDYESEKQAWYARRVEEVRVWQRHYHMEPREDSKLTQLYASGSIHMHPAEVARELVCTDFLYRRTLYGDLLEDFLRCVADGLRRECQAQTGYSLSWTATWNIVRFYGPIALKLMCMSSSGLYMPEHLPDPREESMDCGECVAEGQGRKSHGTE